MPCRATGRLLMGRVKPAKENPNTLYRALIQTESRKVGTIDTTNTAIAS